MLSAPSTRTWTRFALVVSATIVIVAMAVPAHAASLTQTWAQRYVGGTDFQYAKSLAVSPDGGTVYVTGISAGPAQIGDPYDVFATIAYDTSNGDVRWLDRYAFADGDNWASKIVVTPDGKFVFITGATPDGYPVVAYDAATGDRLWVKSVSPAGYVGFEGTLAVSPDSKLVYFAGEVAIGDGPSSRIVTRAFDTMTGAKVWGAKIDAPAGLQARPNAMTLDQQGAHLYVAGAIGNLNAYPSDNPPDFVTIAYDASTGGHVWTRTYAGPVNGGDEAEAVAVTPNGMHVIVAGSSGGSNGQPRYAVLSYAAPTGAKEWVTRDGSPSVWRSLEGMTLNPAGTTIFVTGSESDVYGGRYRTVAYSVANGAKLWSKAFTGKGSSADAQAIAASPDGMYVYVTGSANDGTRDTYATVAYMATTGQRVATAWYDGPEGVYALPEGIGVAPGGRVFVTGRGGGAFATVAYTLTAVI
jgi:hypothetical protein